MNANAAAASAQQVQQLHANVQQQTTQIIQSRINGLSPALQLQIAKGSSDPAVQNLVGQITGHAQIQAAATTALQATTSVKPANLDNTQGPLPPGPIQSTTSSTQQTIQLFTNSITSTAKATTIAQSQVAATGGAIWLL